MKHLSNSEIVDALLIELNVENDNQLAERLEVTRQQINQFRKTKGGQLSHKMLSALLSDSPQS